MHDNDRRETSVLTTLFAHNAWANRKLLDFCATLSEEHLAATAVGGYGSIGTTLMHIVRAEVSYVARVNGKRPAWPLAGDQFPGFDVLKEAVRWAARSCSSWRLPRRTSPSFGSSHRDRAWSIRWRA